MPNPGGGNQFGNFTIQPPYGDVARQTQLTKESPISGSPVAAHALNSARRAQKAGSRPAPQGQAPPPTPAPQAPTGAPAPALPVADIWMRIAQTPGANDTIKRMAIRAANAKP